MSNKSKNNKILTLFDIDDTLFDCYDYKLKSRKASLIPLSLDLKKYNINITFEQLNEKLDFYYRKDTSSYRLYNKLLSEFKIPLKDKKELIKKCVQNHRSVKSEFKTIPNAKLVLDELKKKDFKLGIASSGRLERQLEKLKLIGLLDYFSSDFIFITGDINSYFRRNKKDDKFFKIIYEKISDYKFEKVYMIGNSLESDILPSYKVGFKPILIKSYKYNEKYKKECLRLNVEIISNLLEIIEIVK